MSLLINSLIHNTINIGITHMKDPAMLRLVCTVMWFVKQALISWHPEKKPDYKFWGLFVCFLHFHI